MYNNSDVVQYVTNIMKQRFDWQDIALRTLILVAGVVSASLLILKGNAGAIPALAAGATLGVVLMSPTENSSRD
jgi:hypothetical protein